MAAANDSCAPSPVANIPLLKGENKPASQPLYQTQKWKGGEDDLIV